MKIGIDIGGSHIATGIVKDGTIIGKETRDILLSDIQTESRAKEIILDIIKNEIKYCYKDMIIHQVTIKIRYSSTRKSK